MRYTEESIKNVFTLLNGLTVSGTDNCKRVAMIAQILETPEAEPKERQNNPTQKPSEK